MNTLRYSVWQHWNLKTYIGQNEKQTDLEKIFPVDVTYKSTTKCQLTKSKMGGGEYKVNMLVTHFSILAWEIPWTEEPGVL